MDGWIYGLIDESEGEWMDGSFLRGTQELE